MKNITTLLTFISISLSLYSQGWQISDAANNAFPSVSFGNNLFKEVDVTLVNSTSQLTIELELKLDGRSLSQYGFNSPSFDCYISYNPVNVTGNGFELKDGPDLTDQSVNGATIMGERVWIVGFAVPGNSITIDFNLTKNLFAGVCFDNPNNPNNEYSIPNNNDIHSLKVNFIGHSVTSMNPYHNIMSPFELCTPIVEGPTLLPCLSSSQATNLTELYGERTYYVDGMLPPPPDYYSQNCGIPNFYEFSLLEHIELLTYQPSTKYQMVFSNQLDDVVYVLDQEPEIEKAAILNVNGVIQNLPNYTYRTKAAKKLIVSECILPTENNEVNNPPQIDPSISDIAVTSTNISILNLTNYDLSEVKKPKLEVKAENPLDLDKLLIDWFVRLPDGTEKIINKGTSITALTPGTYFAKARLKNTILYNSASDNYEVFGESSYYVGISENIVVYNSAESTPTILDLFCYPNPATDKVTVNYEYTGKVEKAQIEIYSVMGNQRKLVKDFYIKNQIDNIDVSFLESGNYYIVLRLNDTIWQSTTFVKY